MVYSGSPERDGDFPNGYTTYSYEAEQDGIYWNIPGGNEMGDEGVMEMEEFAHQECTHAFACGARDCAWVQ